MGGEEGRVVVLAVYMCVLSRPVWYATLCRRRGEGLRGGSVMLEVVKVNRGPW